MYIRYTTSTLTIVEINYKQGKFRTKKLPFYPPEKFTNKTVLHVYITHTHKYTYRSIKYYLYTFNKRLK